MLTGTSNPQGYGRLNDSLDEVPRGQPVDTLHQQQPQEVSVYNQSQSISLSQPPQQSDALIQQQQALQQQQQLSSQPLSMPAQQNYYPQPYFQQVQQPSNQPNYQYPPSQYIVQLPIMNNGGNNYPHQGIQPLGQPQQQQQIHLPPQQYVPANLQQGSLKIPSRRTSEQFYCDVCKRTVNSKVIFKNGSGTYLAGFIIGLCGLWLGCCLIPCALDDCKDAQHICSNCGVDIGAKRFLFD